MQVAEQARSHFLDCRAPGILPSAVPKNQPLPKKSRWRAALTVLLSLITVGALAWYLTRPAPLVLPGSDAPLRIENVRIIDVRTGTSTASGHVDIAEGRIIAIHRQGAAGPAPAGATIIDGRGQSLIPGLIDSHCHVGSSPDVPWNRGLPNLDLNLQRLLYSGITRVFDPGAMAPDIYETRAAIDSGEQLGPFLHAAGPIFTAVGGHPAPMVRQTMPGLLADLLLERMTRQIATEADVTPAVQELAALDTDFIKMAIDRIPLTSPRLAPELAAAVSRAAKAHGLRTVAHIGDLQDAKDAADAGVSAWVHGVYKQRLSDADIAALAAYGIPMVPTMVVFKSYGELGRGDYAPTELERQVAPSSLLEDRENKPQDYEVDPELLAFINLLAAQRQAAIDNVRRLHQAGVLILAGSDAQAGVIHGPALHRELDLLAEAQLTPAEVLRATTLHPAQFLSAQQDPPYGVVEEGKQADLVLVRGNPLEDVDALHQIEQVILRGQLLQRVTP